MPSHCAGEWLVPTWQRTAAEQLPACGSVAAVHGPLLKSSCCTPPVSCTPLDVVPLLSAPHHVFLLSRASAPMRPMRPCWQLLPRVMESLGSCGPPSGHLLNHIPHQFASSLCPQVGPRVVEALDAVPGHRPCIHPAGRHSRPRVQGVLAGVR